MEREQEEEAKSFDLGSTETVGVSAAQAEDSLLVLPAETGEKKKKRSRSKKPADMPRRPLSAYNLFFREQRAKLQEGSKKKSKFGFEELGKKIGALWKDIGPEEKKVYQDQAKLEMDRYQKQMELYQNEVAKKARIEDSRFRDIRPPQAESDAKKPVAMTALSKDPAASSASEGGTDPVSLNDALIAGVGSSMTPKNVGGTSQQGMGLGSQQMHSMERAAMPFPAFTQQNVQLAQPRLPFMQQAHFPMGDPLMTGHHGQVGAYDSSATNSSMNNPGPPDNGAQGVMFHSYGHSQQSERNFIGPHLGDGSTLLEPNNVFPLIQQTTHQGSMESHSQIQIPFDGQGINQLSYSSDFFFQQSLSQQQQQQHLVQQLQQPQQFPNNSQQHNSLNHFVHEGYGLPHMLTQASDFGVGGSPISISQQQGGQGFWNDNDNVHSEESDGFGQFLFSEKPPPPSGR